MFLLGDFAVIPLAAKGRLAVTSPAPIQYSPGSLRANLLLPINLPCSASSSVHANDPALTVKAGLSAGPVREWVAIRLGRAKYPTGPGRIIKSSYRLDVNSIR